MSATRPTPYERYLPWRRWVEVGFWVGMTAVNAIANSYTVVVDIRKNDLPYATWEPVVWEWSSGLLWLALVWPVVWEWSSGLLWLALVWPVVWFSRRFPIHWDNWQRQLPWHLLASVVVSLVHVLGMVGLRTLAYASQGQPYEFGDWPRELFYEYVKDVRTYVGMVVLISFYRLMLRRLQGEASLLAEPDEGPPVESLDRPERFLVRKLGRDFLVAAGDIEWLQASGNYVNLRVRGHDYPLRSTIAGIETRLDPRVFARVHRSYIVNLGQVASIEPLDAGEARLHLLDGTVIPCSRRYRQALRERIDGAAASA